MTARHRSLLAAAALILSFPALAGASNSDVSFVRILRVTQAPYNPVVFRVWEKAPVGHEIYVGVNVYLPGSPTRIATISDPRFAQTYYSTSLNVTWNKRGADGSRVPPGTRLIARAYATDLSTGQQQLFPSSIVYFSLTS
jgi:hypothetical protein